MTAAEAATLASANFGYLAEVDPVLARYGALAEHYFALEPRDSVSKLRQMAELMAQLAAARVGIEVLQGDKFIDVLRMLQQRDVLPREAADLFHFIRKNGNIAVHDHDKEASHGTAPALPQAGPRTGHLVLPFLHRVRRSSRPVRSYRPKIRSTPTAR